MSNPMSKLPLDMKTAPSSGHGQTHSVLNLNCRGSDKLYVKEDGPAPFAHNCTSVNAYVLLSHSKV